MSEEVKTYSQMRKEFHEKYKNEILPLMKSLEDTRKTKFWYAVGVSILVGILSFIVIYLPILFTDPENDITGFFLKLSSGVAISLIIFSWQGIKKDFEFSIKEKIMPKVCSCYGNMQWMDGRDVALRDEAIFEKSYVVPEHTLQEYDDIFKGVHRNVAFKIVESRCSRREGKYTIPVFKGIIIRLAMNKKFTSHTVIKLDSIMHLSPSKNLKHTKFEDVVFEKAYDVFTNNEVEARYLITPAFMDRLNKMKIAFCADNMTCAFYKKSFLIALHTKKDLFSLCSLVKSLNKSEPYFQMYEEIVSILKLIDHFKLGQKIGL